MLRFASCGAAGMFFLAAIVDTVLDHSNHGLIVGMLMCAALLSLATLRLRRGM